MILSIETSTEVCSVVLSEGDNVLFERVEPTPMSHARCLAPFVDEAMTYVRAEGRTLRAVAVSAGPGSYTGLRIGASLAKGLAYALHVPLIAIPTLRAMTHHALRRTPGIPADARFLPMIDARRMEVFCALYDARLDEVGAPQAAILSAESPLPFAPLVQSMPLYFFGNGASKCATLIGSAHPDAVFLPDVAPLAADVAALAEREFQAAHFVDLAYFEPFYLKDFQPTTPTKSH